MIPAEVYAIAKYWGGHGVEPSERDMGDGESVYTFWSDDGIGYLVSPPGVPMPVYEDSGEPCGEVVVDPPAWAVRASTDAPDSWWVVGLDGVYRGYAGTQRIFEPQDRRGPG